MRKVIFVLLFTCSLFQTFAQPLDGIVKREILAEKMPMQHQSLREADILWEKKIWQIIDVREKQNQPIMFPERPLFEIITNAIEAEELTAYSTENDKFTKPLLPEEVHSVLYRIDTVVLWEPETYDEQVQVVETGTYNEDIQRFRTKEVWFFNSKTSEMDVRIIGIAPMKNVEDDGGNFLYEQPLFWIYFPELRSILAKEQVFNSNSISQTSWDDWFEQRRFSATVFKENNVLDRRLKDYLVGMELLTEAGKIKSEIFNFEQDVWSR